MKIMQINVVYPNGSTGSIVNDIHYQLLDNGYKSIVCFGRGNNVKTENVYKIAPELIMKAQSLCSKVTGYAYGGCYYSTKSLLNIIKKEKPDVVHLHCINGYIVNIFKLLEYLKINNIPTVLTLHAEFMYTAGCGHALNCEKWKTGCGHCPQKGMGRPSSKIFDRSADEWRLMESSFKGFDNLIITSVSGWLHNRAKQSPFFINKELKIVFNGIDTKNIFKPTDFSNLKDKYSISDEKIILHVTANFNDPIKGGEHVLEIAERLKNENILIIIVGYNGNKNRLPENVIVVPKTNNQTTLAAFYSMADITLLTSVKETYSMICAESLACGTPVVGFKAGAPETIAIKEYSEFVRQGDIKLLAKTIIKNLYNKEKYGNEVSGKAALIYSKLKMYDEYLNIYQMLLRGTD